MVIRSIAIISGCLAVWAISPGTAIAFEQQQAPALAQPPGAPPPVAGKGKSPLDLGKEVNSTAEEEDKGLKSPGLGTFSAPKLNFGLDLMYGNPDTDTSNLGFTNDPLIDKSDDLTIMGKFKKRF